MPISLLRMVRERVKRGDASPAVTLAELLLHARNAEAVAQALALLLRQKLAPSERCRAVEIAELLSTHRASCDRVVTMLSLETWADEHATEDTHRLAACRRLFDDLVERSEEASVALYSLGDASLLERATDEVVQRMRRLGLLRATSSVLQIGCGIGRFEAALSSQVAEVHGIDLSPKMIEAAVRRCARRKNVFLTVGSGRDLSPYEDARFDLVYAVDSMPYIVEAGHDVVEAYFRESMRVLNPNGKVLIYNYSYRGDALRDCAEVLDLAARFGLNAKICDGTPFSFWNGHEFLLERKAESCGPG